MKQKHIVKLKHFLQNHCADFLIKTGKLQKVSETTLLPESL